MSNKWLKLLNGTVSRWVNIHYSLYKYIDIHFKNKKRKRKEKCPQSRKPITLPPSPFLARNPPVENRRSRLLFRALVDVKTGKEQQNLLIITSWSRPKYLDDNHRAAGCLSLLPVALALQSSNKPWRQHRGKHFLCICKSSIFNFLNVFFTFSLVLVMHNHVTAT